MSNLFIADTLVQCKTEARFLGVIVDNKLSWSQHIKAIKSKMSRYVGIMYRIKNLLPIQARLQIFHSFIQSHLNFCSLVWGFSTKSNIESLFTSQKKGMRAVMPGYINFFYMDGKLPAHTKSGFSNFGVLTVQGVIVKNSLLFMHKINNFERLLPISIRETIANDAPSRGSDHVTCQGWLAEFGTNSYRNSLFFKGPLLYIDPACSQLLSSPTSILSVNAYKTNLKRLLLDIQNKGDRNEWQSDNFLLYNINGLRKSERLN